VHSNEGFSRVKTFAQPLPATIERDVSARLSDVAKLLRAVAPDLQDLNRYRYARQFMGLEELVEALTFLAYVRTARLLSPAEVQQQVDHLVASAPAPATPVASDSNAPPAAAAPQPTPTIRLDEDDYIMGVFDLTGEIMRFATTNRQFVLPHQAPAAAPAAAHEPAQTQTQTQTQTLSVLRDMQRLESMVRLLPPPGRHSDPRHVKAFTGKMDVLLASVHKVEVLAYGLAVRGSERPEGWVPDLDERMGEE
jgi:hypothetical protein